jgi:hypothetical protein
MRYNFNNYTKKTKETINIHLANFKRYIIKSLFKHIACFFGLLACVLFLINFKEWQGIKLLELKMRDVLMKKLDVSYIPEQTPESVIQDKRKRTIYVLGGTQRSLRVKYATTARLYHEESAEKILILTSPGITEYDEALNRNLTNDEWSIKQLTNLGIERNRIEFIQIHKGFFGTLSEAKTLDDIISNREIKRLLLVSSSYHKKRVWVTFSALLRHTGVEIQIYSAEENVHVTDLLIEYLKLIFYENLLIPLEVWSMNKPRNDMSIHGMLRQVKYVIGFIIR